MEESLNDGVWIARCVARMVEFDPVLDPALAQPVAEDMNSRPRWRNMSPEEAARAVFAFSSSERLRQAV